MPRCRSLTGGAPQPFRGLPVEPRGLVARPQFGQFPLVLDPAFLGDPIRVRLAGRKHFLRGEFREAGDLVLFATVGLLQVLPQRRGADHRLLDLHRDNAQAEPTIAVRLGISIAAALGDRP